MGTGCGGASRPRVRTSGNLDGVNDELQDEARSGVTTSCRTRRGAEPSCRTAVQDVGADVAFTGGGFGEGTRGRDLSLGLATQRCAVRCHYVCL